MIRPSLESVHKHVVVRSIACLVLAPDVHEQRVVGDAKDPGGLRGGHALVPDVLQSLGEVIVGPGPGRTSAWSRVLSFVAAS